MIDGAVAKRVCHTPLRLVSTIALNTGSEWVSASPIATTPAFAMTMSISPSSSIPDCIPASNCARSRTSAMTGTTLRPAAWTRRTVSSRSDLVASGYGIASISAQRSTAMMSAPCSASATAWLRPWPRPAPVITAIALSSSPMTARYTAKGPSPDWAGNRLHRQCRAGLFFGECHETGGRGVVARNHRAADEYRAAAQAEPAADADIAARRDRFADAVQRGRCPFVDVVGQPVGHSLDRFVRQRHQRRVADMRQIRSHPSRVGELADDRRPGGTQSAVQLQTPQHHCKLGLRIGPQPRPLVATQMKVVEVQLRRPVRVRADVDDLRTYPGQQQVGQCERAEQVGAQRHLEPVDRVGTAVGESAGVVDQDVHVTVDRLGE